MVIISDTSILINLAGLNQIELLHRLYGKVLIPSAVWEEIVIKGAGQPGAAEVESAQWINVARPQNDAFVRSLRQTIDQGEAEAIALALELEADLLLMDERLGRAAAQSFHLDVVGVVGILVRAKHQGLLREVRPLLDQLRNVVGFYISSSLYQKALQLAEED